MGKYSHWCAGTESSATVCQCIRVHLVHLQDSLTVVPPRVVPKCQQVPDGETKFAALEMGCVHIYELHPVLAIVWFNIHECERRKGRECVGKQKS